MTSSKPCWQPRLAGHVSEAGHHCETMLGFIWDGFMVEFQVNFTLIWPNRQMPE